jgi:hypothetical protein
MAALAEWLSALALALGACRRIEEPAPSTRASQSARLLSARSSASVAPTPSTPAARLSVTRALELPSSAYQAALFTDDQAVELLTQRAVYRFVRGEPAQERKLDLGFAATVTRLSYVYWSQGALWSVARGDSRAPPTRVVALPEQPQRLVSDIRGSELAWLERSTDDRYSITTLTAERVKRLYTSAGSIDDLTLVAKAACFVERPSRGGFRVGCARLTDGALTFTSEKTGRWPAMLRGLRDLVYYDGSRRTVVALSLDLQHETPLAQDFICSPLCAAAAVYCANLTGIYELTRGAPPRELLATSGQVITSLAANADRLAFVTDLGARGQDRLALNVASLPNARGR